MLISLSVYMRVSMDVLAYLYVLSKLVCILQGVGGGVLRWCWVNFQCWGVLLIWVRLGQGPTALAVGADWGCLDIFSLVYHFSFLSPSLGDGPI